MIRKSLLSAGVLAMAMVAMPAVSGAAEINYAQPREWSAGNIRYASFTGTITLLPNESVADVRIIYGNKTWANAGEAQGTFNVRGGAYSAVIGATDMQTYSLQVTIRRGNNPGNITIFRSPVFQWKGQ